MRITTEQILCHWLAQRNNEYFGYHHIEQELPKFGLYNFKVLHNASTYARAFRKYKEKYPEKFRTETINNNYQIWRLTEEKCNTSKLRKDQLQTEA